MRENLFLKKGKNNFGKYADGICMVISHKGIVVGETNFENGSGFYRFKVIGASKKKTDRNGIERRQTQRLFCTVRKDSYLAKTAKSLEYGDILEIFGVLKSSEFITDSGKKRRTNFCNLCKLEIKVKADGNLPTNEEDTNAEVDESELDDLFDDL